MPSLCNIYLVFALTHCSCDTSIATSNFTNSDNRWMLLFYRLLHRLCYSLFFSLSLFWYCNIFISAWPHSGWFIPHWSKRKTIRMCVPPSSRAFSRKSYPLWFTILTTCMISLWTIHRANASPCKFALTPRLSTTGMRARNQSNDLTPR